MKTTRFDSNNYEFNHNSKIGVYLIHGFSSSTYEMKLLAEFLEMDTSDNFITAYNDIKYTGLDGLVLADKVEKVQVSNRIVDSPCVLVTGEYGWTANMERIMKAQALGGNNPMFGNMSSKKTMEINASHSIIKRLRTKINDSESVKMAADLIWLLYETAVLTSGFTLKKPTLFASRIHKLIDFGLADDDDDGEEESDGEGGDDCKNMNLHISDYNVEGGEAGARGEAAQGEDVVTIDDMTEMEDVD